MKLVHVFRFLSFRTFDLRAMYPRIPFESIRCREILNLVTLYGGVCRSISLSLLLFPSALLKVGHEGDKMMLIVPGGRLGL